MPGVSTAEWLDAIHAYYERNMTLPVLVAAEALLDRTDAAEVAGSIVARGIAVGDDEMTATTEADVADAIGELIAIGFLESVVSIDGHYCEEHFDCEEHLLELRYP